MLKIYDTLRVSKENFIPRREGRIDMFVCGPTVYDYSHIGHARTYVFFDTIVKYLRSLGYDVKYIQNITDIDDKIIQRAREENTTPQYIADKYEKVHLEDMKSLGIDAVNTYARATDNIAGIIKQIETLVEKDFAYVAPAVTAHNGNVVATGHNNDVYFSIEKFPEFGKLSKQKIDQLETGVRIEIEANKHNPRDFVLWKAQNYQYEPTWNSPWGMGRPGWHIEDTAITEHYLGPQYDIHGGGQELIFPHHEAEIAQEESASGLKPMVNYWMHTGWLLVNGEKMSKSLHNSVTIHEVLEKYSSEAMRLMFLSGYYRAPMDYTEDLAKQNEAAVSRIANFYRRLGNADSENQSYDAGHDLQEAWQKFMVAMNDDFNTSLAIAAVFDLIRKVNPLLAENRVPRDQAKKIRKFLEEINKIIGIVPLHYEKIPTEINNIAEAREEARIAKDWQKADGLREKIESLGYRVEDTLQGPYLSRK